MAKGKRSVSAGYGDTEAKSILKSVGHELKESPPSALEKTKRKKGAAAAEGQRRAILLSKARARGARIPKKRKK